MLMTIMRKILLHIFLLFSFSISLVAQELIPLNYNHAIKKQLVKSTDFKSAVQQKYMTPPLPDGSHYFFDDFANYNYSVYPDENLWSDKSAYVNQTYPDSCVSIGVATLDGINSKGELYSLTEGNFPSDTLTSQDIDLSGVAGNVYLSFFYQGGGKGDQPEENDSLILDFYHSDSARWYTFWYSLGFQSNKFEQVVLGIGDSLHREDFKFRFRNWTSTDIRDSKGGDESGITNSDQWHIDYVQIRNVASESAMYEINDASFVFPLKSIHKYYNAIPHKHIDYSIGDRRATSDITVRKTFSSDPSIIVRRRHETYNIYKGQRERTAYTQIYDNEQFDDFVDYADFFSHIINYNPLQEYGMYEYVSYIDIVPVQYRWNDTIKKVEIYKDYYAYDDGTAEFGFGLPGNGGINMRLAYKFPLSIRGDNPADTLTAIDIHFVRTRNNASSAVEFQICVWANNDTIPGELIYPELVEGEFPGTPVYTPDTTLGINEFMRIKLEDELLVKDTIYIGLVQRNLGTLAIGYDINSNSRSSIFTNDGNQWQRTIATIPEGAIMMRPVFGHYVYTNTKETSLIDNKEQPFNVYPIPVKDYLSIQLNESNTNIEDYHFSVYNMVGNAMIIEQPLSEEVDFSLYPSGMYILRIRNIHTSEYFTHKILKSK